MKFTGGVLRNHLNIGQIESYAMKKKLNETLNAGRAEADYRKRNLEAGIGCIYCGSGRVRQAKTLRPFGKASLIGGIILVLAGLVVPYLWSIGLLLIIASMGMNERFAKCWDCNRKWHVPD